MLRPSFENHKYNMIDTFLRVECITRIKLAWCPPWILSNSNGKPNIFYPVSGNRIENVISDPYTACDVARNTEILELDLTRVMVAKWASRVASKNHVYATKADSEGCRIGPWDEIRRKFVAATAARSQGQQRIHCDS